MLLNRNEYSRELLKENIKIFFWGGLLIRYNNSPRNEENQTKKNKKNKQRWFKTDLNIKHKSSVTYLLDYTGKTYAYENVEKC